MALTVNHPTLKEVQAGAHSPSIGASAVAAYARAPFRGRIVKMIAVTGGTITTADATVSTAVNGTAITNGNITITATGAAAGQVFTSLPSGANMVVEDDVISFTASGASGASVPCTYYAVIQSA